MTKSKTDLLRGNQQRMASIRLRIRKILCADAVSFTSESHEDQIMHLIDKILLDERIWMIEQMAALKRVEARGGIINDKRASL